MLASVENRSEMLYYLLFALVEYDYGAVVHTESHYKVGTTYYKYNTIFVNGLTN
jgi:hypothetical protein